MDRELTATSPVPRWEYGLLLPHFGSQASRERLTSGLSKLERLGFDAVWVRDHVVYHPHEHEDQDQTHVDPFLVLASAAATTSSLKLGTATLIPHRHPVHAAGLLGGLDFLAGPGRVIAGWGIGNYDHEFEAVGIGGWDRREVIEENIEVIRRLLSGDAVTFQGKFYDFADVQLRPVPLESRPIPIWYGGGSPAAVRRAVEYCDGWLPSRIPMRVFKKRMARMGALAAEHARRPPDVGVVPLVVLAPTIEDGVRRLNMEALLEATNQIYGSPTEPAMTSLEDLDGAAIVGPPEHVAEQVTRFQDEGVSHFVFDLRQDFAHWEESVVQLAEDVLPLLRRGDRRAATEYSAGR